MKTKRCTKCKRILPIAEFNNDKIKKDGKRYVCKECIKQYRQENKEKIREINKRYKLKYPWSILLSYIKTRCKKTGDSYYNKGIKCLITKEQIKKLWFRDKAYLMKTPCIHRKNNNGNYIINNCIFIERKIHIKIHLQGEANCNSRLTRRKIIGIRQTRKDNPEMSHRKIAEKYGVAKTTIGCIINYSTWKHI